MEYVNEALNFSKIISILHIGFCAGGLRRHHNHYQQPIFL